MEKRQNEECYIHSVNSSSRTGKEYIIRETVITRLMLPFIQIFALYIIIHGETSPGGGFQGGVILGTSCILYILVYGLEEGRKRISEGISDIFSTAGVLIFGTVGIAAMLAGGNFLEYTALPLESAKLASHLSILIVEIAIGITVAAVMITLFCETIRRDEND